MTELELQLRELARVVEFPPTPALAPRVRARIAAEPARPRRFPRRRLALSLAVVVAALAGALAVPPVRAALLDLLRIGGARIERVERLPATAPRRGLSLGTEVSLAEARRRAGFRVEVPDDDVWGEPDAVFVRPLAPAAAVSLVYGSEQRVRLLVTQLRGRTEPVLVKKAAAAGTRIEGVTVRGRPGFWISGRPHAVLFRDPNGAIREDAYRLAANVLLWVEEGVTFRIEGRLSLAQALDVAESLR